MKQKEQGKKIQEIYNEAIKKLEMLKQERINLVNERKRVVREYIKDLEIKKVDEIRASIELLNN